MPDSSVLPVLDKSRPLTAKTIKAYIAAVDSYLGLTPVSLTSHNDDVWGTVTRKGVWIEMVKNPSDPTFSKREERYRLLDFSGATFQSGEDLSGVDFGWSNLSNVIARNVNFTDANFGFANMNGMDARKANLNKVYMSYHSMKGMDLRGADLFCGEINQLVDIEHYHAHPELKWYDRRGRGGSEGVRLDSTTILDEARLGGLDLDTDVSGVNFGNNTRDLTSGNFRAAIALTPELLPLTMSIPELAEERREYAAAHPAIPIQLSWETDEPFIKGLEDARQSIRSNDSKKGGWVFIPVDPSTLPSAHLVDGKSPYKPSVHKSDNLIRQMQIATGMEWQRDDHTLYITYPGKQPIAALQEAIKGFEPRVGKG
jgi:hypothetical protein